MMLGRLLGRLLRDETGSANPEWALIATILVLGAITGVIAARHTMDSLAQQPTIVQSR